MSGFGGRRAPSFAQYLDDLNTIPSPYDQSLQQQQNESFNIDAELELFTNTEFLDFGHFGDMSLPLAYNPAEDEKPQEKKPNTSGKHGDMNYMDMLNDFNGMPEYSNEFNSASHTMPMNTAFPSLSAADESTFTSDSLEKAASITTQTPKSSSSPAAGSVGTVSTPIQVTGGKRKQSQDSKNLDESARQAAEEDKRRRNTAASARFRVKKKQREQALERSVKEANEKNSALEARLSQLELENKWLKNLITEKNGEDSTDITQKSETDIAQMFKKFLASQKSTGERQTSSSKIGVGTA
ncbi:putative bZIP transcription factor [Talaromyces proteolyticus]|uniref:BZIP transcription factor n=1 Tax=Talaromyces proteolyticus TaxID=1131652 RepID=A0AAD4KRF6_9EURO|nr:putative bZIP transcription factor [Talaromyces proteolyticus]KAH8697288.1 putative bZIP transcription factor [Talaromyces proteolyticus]